MAGREQYSATSGSPDSSGEYAHFGELASNGRRPSSGAGGAEDGKVVKRGARACTNCRRGKNKCEGNWPCKRCAAQGLECIFEKPDKKNTAAYNSQRVDHLENRVGSMQNQLLTMQSNLSEILSHIRGTTPLPSPSSTSSLPCIAPQGASSSSAVFSPPPPSALRLPSLQQNSPFSHAFQLPSFSDGGAGGRPPPFAPRGGPPFSFPGMEPPQQPPQQSSLYPPPPPSSTSKPPRSPNPAQKRKFPALPGYAAPAHPVSTYGLVPSTPASDDEDEQDSSTIPSSHLGAPLEALQELANAAANADPGDREGPKVKKRKRADPPPPNAFPDVVTKGLIRDTEARELYNIFFSGCHLFVPQWDPQNYDTYESFRERTPFCFNACMHVSAGIRAGSGPPGPAYYRAMEEAHGIARSSLLAPVVRKEAVQAVLTVAAWSATPWLPSGHAMRMALELGLHRAVEKLIDGRAPGFKPRSEEDERDIVVSARIWLTLYAFDHRISLGNERPIILRDEDSVRGCRALLGHPMSCPTDVRLVAEIELVSHKTRIYDALLPLRGRVDSSTLAFVRRAVRDLDKWYVEWAEIHRQHNASDVLCTMLAGELHYAKLWLHCLVLRGVLWERMSVEQRELAFAAKDAAIACLHNTLHNNSYRLALRYAVHHILVTAAFSAIFLLKVAMIFPKDVDLQLVSSEVEQLATCLSEISADRYALTIRLMLSNFHRTVMPTPRPSRASSPHPSANGNGLSSAASQFNLDAVSFPPDSSFPQWTDDGGLAAMGITWPASDAFDPASLPLWIQESSFGDLGLPMDGSQSVILPPELASLFLPPGSGSLQLDQSAGGELPQVW